jgi:protein SCO1/2
MALVVAGCFGIALVVTLIVTRGDGDAPAADVLPTEFEGATLPDGVRAPDFRLKDENGDPITMRQYRGRPVIVSFMYSTCRDTCPAQAQQVKGALDDLGHDVPAIAISVDPANDTPRNAQRFNGEQRVTGRISWVLGDRAQLRPLWKGYFVHPQTKDLEHQARLVIVDGKGLQRVGYPLDQVTPERVAHDVKKLESG